MLIDRQKFLKLTVAIGISTVAVACAAPADDSVGDQEVVAAEQLVSTCTEGEALLQRRASSAVRYLAGGPNPFPSTDAGAEAKFYFDQMKQWIASEGCTFGSVSAGTVAGCPAAKRFLNCGALTEYTKGKLIYPMEYALVALWGSGITTFFRVGENGSGFYLDPEPARLLGSLGSSAGATYVNSGADTTAYQLPGSWVSGSQPAGAPCSTYPISSGATVYKYVLAYGSLRKCI